MIRVHHLNRSRSLRILWLLEEAGTPYEVIRHERDAETNLAPDSLRAVHPLGKSPVIEDDGEVVFETGAIVEYLCARHAPDMVPEAGTAAHIRHLELMHFAEGSAMLPILLRLYTSRLGEAAKVLEPRITSELSNHFGFMENQIRDSGHFVLDRVSAADIMLSFPAQIAMRYGMGDRYPKLRAFTEMIAARPAWQRAVAAGGGD